MAILAAAALPVLASEKIVEESDEAALDRVKGEILSLIGQAPCRNIVHCRLLPLGRRPCGGPAEYLAYSSGFSDRTALETKASEYAFLLEEIQSGQVGACVVLPEPQAVCIDNRCRVQPRGK
ncbi:MAG: hypothetical protein ACKVQA_15745 [Burkholderiales bacterium]